MSISKCISACTALVQNITVVQGAFDSFQLQLRCCYCCSVCIVDNVLQQSVAIYVHLYLALALRIVCTLQQPGFHLGLYIYPSVRASARWPVHSSARRPARSPVTLVQRFRGGPLIKPHSMNSRPDGGV